MLEYTQNIDNVSKLYFKLKDPSALKIILQDIAYDHIFKTYNYEEEDFLTQFENNEIKKDSEAQGLIFVYEKLNQKIDNEFRKELARI